MKMDTYTKSELVIIFNLNCHLTKPDIWSRFTYITIAYGGSHPAVHVVDVTGRTGNQGGASVHNSLASAIASNNLSVNGDALGGKAEIQRP